MGNIKFTINIEHAEFLLIMLVLLIAVVALIGVFAWWHKTDKQIETLSQIKNNLDGEKEENSKVNVTVINNGDQPSTKHCNQEELKDPPTDKPKPRVEEIIEEEPDEPVLDIAALVAKDSLEKLERESRAKTAQHIGVGKSGRVYTEEELEELINS
ncbi:MAG: hypothetical protein RR967_05470 [Anaerovoracaceae bacterium]